MFMLVVALAFVTAVASANGQSTKARATVPFDFIVGSETLSSGAYSVQSITSGGDVLRIQSSTSTDSAARLTMPAEGKSEQAKLVFHRYGDTYFLAQVWNGSGDAGRELPKSKAEKEVASASLNGSRPKAEIAVLRPDR